MSGVIMIQGTMSGVGKSWIVTGLCRIFRQDGYSVAPFKSQNMSHAFVTEGGLEMSRAQAVQAEAAGAVPSVSMNPILLKPVNETGSELVVNGRPRGYMRAGDYFSCKETLTAETMRAYRDLSSRYDVIVVEGAGSPAEINLRQGDFVNMGLAEMIDAPVLLAGDVNRGGVFAQLVGTLALLEDSERDRIKGLIINKFRGDLELFRPGIAMLEERAGKPVIGTIPYLDIDIEDEDEFTERDRKAPAQTKASGLNTGAAASGLSAGDADSRLSAGNVFSRKEHYDRSGVSGAAAYREEQYDKLADALRQSLDMNFVYNILA